MAFNGRNLKKEKRKRQFKLKELIVQTKRKLY